MLITHPSRETDATGKIRRRLAHLFLEVRSTLRTGKQLRERVDELTHRPSVVVLRTRRVICSHGVKQRPRSTAEIIAHQRTVGVDRHLLLESGPRVWIGGGCVAQPVFEVNASFARLLGMVDVDGRIGIGIAEGFRVLVVFVEGIESILDGLLAAPWASFVTDVRGGVGIDEFIEHQVRRSRTRHISVNAENAARASFFGRGFL